MFLLNQGVIFANTYAKSIQMALIVNYFCVSGNLDNILFEKLWSNQK